MNIDLDAFRAFVNDHGTVHVRDETEFDGADALFAACGYEIGYAYGYEIFRKSPYYIGLGNRDTGRIHCRRKGPFFEDSTVIEYAELERKFPAGGSCDSGELPDFSVLMAMMGVPV